MKVAIVYDWANQIGGAERVLEAIHEIWPQAPLFTSVFDQKRALWAKKFHLVKTSFLQKIPGAKKHYRIFGPLMAIAFEQFNFDQFDLVISVTSGPAKAIIAKPQTCHICYCLTPHRYLWMKRFLSHQWLFPFLAPLRVRDYFFSQRPDYFLTISKTVARRVKKFYGREAKVVYPGVLKKRELKKIKKKDYFLIVSRLIYHKRVDLAIKAFNKLGWPLKIVGQGPEKVKLETMAKTNIEFLGEVSEKQLWSLYEKAKAVICPQEEDFGLVAVESQLAGTSVVSFGAGGARETIVKGITGEFFNKQNEKSLAKVLKLFSTKKYSPEKCWQNSQGFLKKFFLLEFKKTIGAIWKEYQKKNAFALLKER